MDKAKCAGDIGVGQFGVEIRDLRSQQQALVHDGARRERGHVEHASVLHVGGRDLRFRALADDVEFALKGVLVEVRRTANENLLDVRLGNSSDPAYGSTVNWSVSPTQNFQSLFANDALQNSFTLKALMSLDRQECHADAVGARRGQLKPQLQALAREKLVWNLDQDPGAVAGFRVAAASAAVRKADQDLNALLDDVVALVAADARTKAHSARVVLVSGVVQPLGGGQSVRDGRGPLHDSLAATPYPAQCAVVLCYARPLRSSSEAGSPSSLVQPGDLESTIQNFDS